MWLGGKLLPGAREFVRHLRAHDHEVRFLTNNSGATGADLAARLTALGVPTAAGHVFTPLDILPDLQVLASAGTVLALGSTRLTEVLTASGLEVVREPSAAAAANAVVLGRFAGLTLAHLEAASNVLWRGGTLIALNADARVPAENGSILVGVGAVAACLERASGVEALVVGKPSATFFEAALRHFGATAANAIMIGDTFEVDITGAKRIGMGTILLEATGAPAPSERRNADPEAPDAADIRAADLRELLTRWKETGRGG